MLTQGPRIDDRCVAPALSILVLGISLIVKFAKPLTWLQFAGLLANLEGTVLLASGFSANIPPHGSTMWDSLKWAVKEFPKFGSPPSFNPVRFYVGLLVLLLGTILTTMAG